MDWLDLLAAVGRQTVEWITGTADREWWASPLAGTVIGSTLGATLGFVSLVLGALWNAHLNRVRDDEQRWLEKLSVASALKAELGLVRQALAEYVERLSKFNQVDVGGFETASRLYAEFAGKIGLFDHRTVQSVISAYGFIENYRESVRRITGNDRSGPRDDDREFTVYNNQRENTWLMFTTLVLEHIDDAIQSLDRELSR